MPIRPDLRHFYRTPEYRAARQRVVERAGSKCEQCHKPNGQWVETVTFKNFAGQGFMLWRGITDSFWGWMNGKYSTARDTDEFFGGRGWRRKARRIRVVLTLAHLNHDPSDNRDSNLKFLCQWCHLNYDKLHHKETRQMRKDKARSVLQVAL